MMERKRDQRHRLCSGASALDTEIWWESHHQELISCPYQPGNLKLLSLACAKRYRTANEPRWMSIGSEPFPIYIIKMNLQTCRTCQIGSRFAAEPSRLSA